MVEQPVAPGLVVSAQPGGDGVQVVVGEPPEAQAPQLGGHRIVADHDRSAIYRNLGQFEELGIAEHVHLGHGQAVYRLAGLATVPVLCSTCGATFDLDRAQTRAFAQRVAKLTGVTLDLTHFPLTGTCDRCT